MKKYFYTLLIVMAAVFVTTGSFAQPRYPAPMANNQVRFESFFYYPQSNVYYSFRTHQYIYPSHGGWQIANRLPHYIRIGREDRVTIEHRGFDVWNDNAQHQYTYCRRYNTSPAIVYTPDRRYNGY
jgi:hypothetical protein